MINLRVRCLPEEIEQTKRALEQGFEIIKLRGPYADRFPLRTVRAYVNVTPKLAKKLSNKLSITSEQINEAWQKSKNENLI